MIYFPVINTYIFIISIPLLFYFITNNFNYVLIYYLIEQKSYLFFNFNFFSVVVLFIAIYFTFLITTIAENKSFSKPFVRNFILVFPIISYLYVYTNNIIIFFYTYELFLLPSIYLVYYLSPNKRSLIAVFYFLIWTQLGSFLVFVYVILFIEICNNWTLINNQDFFMTNFNKQFLFALIFIGFGIKVPIWPFYYWLTKTHVEAPTFFSIYLSGFLVKTALFGFYKLFFFLNFNHMYIYLSILLFGVCDVSLKFFSQVDLKKLVAYSTVQEMNLIYLGLLWGSKKSIVYVSLFSLTHALLSTMFFFIIDIIYKRYYSRSILNVSGLIINYPLISLLLILSCLNYNGFPLSLKFLLEVFLFLSFFETNFFSVLVLTILLNWIGTINFTYLWFRTLFGINYCSYKKYNLDISKKELIIFWVSFFIFYQFSYVLFLAF